MKILLRISYNSFGKPIPFGLSPKPKAVAKALETLKLAGVDKHELIVISDGYPQADFPLKYDEWLDKRGFGNEGTFKAQTQYTTSLNDDEIVLYLEDDYIWRPDTLDSLEEAVKTLGFVSPYDHPAHYLEPRFDKIYETALIGNLTYRTAPSNTLTFAAPVRLIKKHEATLQGHGINDHEMFQTIIASGDKLWNPCYSMATHLVEGCEAPNVRWQDVIKYS